MRGSIENNTKSDILLQAYR